MAVNAAKFVAGGSPVFPTAEALQASQIPSNTTLLQPGAVAFRLSDAIQENVAIISALTEGNGSAIGALQAQITTLQGQVSTLQSQVSTLQGQTAAFQAFMNSFNWVQVEVSTGLTFLDGRTLYTRSYVISGAQNAANNTFTYAHGIPNINYIAQVIAVVGLNNPSFAAPIFYGNTSAPLSDAIGIWVDTTNIYISNGTVIRTNYLTLVKLYYTATDR